MEINKDLVAASATPLVLAILVEGESYGYAIQKRVSELSGGRLEWSDGMLYPVLHRLERLGLIAGTWQQAETGRRRKYYRITPKGKEQLATERQQWQAVDSALRNIWSLATLRQLAALRQRAPLRQLATLRIGGTLTPNQGYRP